MKRNDEYSELLVNLGKKLKTICNDDDFVVGVLSDVWDSEEDQRALMDFIEAGEDVNEETVSVLAMELGDTREASH